MQYIKNIFGSMSMNRFLKVKYLISLIVILMFINNTFAQQIHRYSYINTLSGAKALAGCGIDTTDLVKIRRIADSSEHDLNDFARLFLAQHGINDSLPKVEESFYKSLKAGNWWKQYYYLATLMIKNNQQSHFYALTMLDSMNIQKQEMRVKYPADNFASTIEILLDFNDYSKYELFKSLFDGYDRPRSYDIGIFYRFVSDSTKELNAFESVKNLLNDRDNDFRLSACNSSLV